jgi:PAS domain S-box-containing protein
MNSPPPTDREVFFPDSEIIVSKTDLKGRLTYCNKTFCSIAGYREAELLGKPHSVLRHPEMPRAVFKLLWDTIMARREVFAYVKNITKAGDFYWVFAHVTPSFGRDGAVVGYHSNRRIPSRAALDRVIVPLYAKIRAAEAQPRNGKEALAAGVECLDATLAAQKVSYEQFVLTI